MSEQTLGQAVSVMHGQAAPASSSSLGSRQGLWPTPCANNPNEGETLESWDRRQALNKAKHNNGNGAGTPLAIKVKQEEFPTPRTCDWKSSPNASQNEKRMEAGQATLGEFVHAKHKKGDLWSTPRTGATESSRPNNKGGIPLADQAKRENGWLKPKVPSGGSQSQRTTPGGGLRKLEDQAERANGKLNPRWVETLMGLPVGWVMPSCKSPVTIAPTNSDSSATVSSPPPQSELFEC